MRYKAEWDTYDQYMMRHFPQLEDRADPENQMAAILETCNRHSIGSPHELLTAFFLPKRADLLRSIYTRRSIAGARKRLQLR